jgi:hypothetical protein
MILILAHLFRTKGSPVRLEEAVEYLSFRWRYGYPTEIRRMLTAAEMKGMLDRRGDLIEAQFLFDKQELSPNQAIALENAVHLTGDYDPMT